MDIGEWLDETTKLFAKNGINSASLDALILIEYILGTPRATLLTHPETNLPATTIAKLATARKQRLSGIPIAYILNKKEFYGRDFMVNEHVLIPRPETETIIDIVKSLPVSSPKIADIGTGSGCMGITLALELPGARVIAIDNSQSALAVAKQNAKYLGARVTFKQSNLFSKITGRKFDIVCANLPYVPNNLTSSPELAAEPKTALFSGKDGLNHYRHFFKELGQLPNKPRYVITEALQKQHGPVEKLAGAAGYRLIKADGLIQLFGAASRVTFTLDSLPSRK